MLPYKKLSNSAGVTPNLDFILTLPEKPDFRLQVSQIATVGQPCNIHQHSIKGDKHLLNYLQAQLPCHNTRRTLEKLPSCKE